MRLNIPYIFIEIEKTLTNIRKQAICEALEYIKCIILKLM